MTTAGDGNPIGTLNEGPLHEDLKAWYAEPGDELEAPVDGFYIDIRRDDLLVEVQTGSLNPIRDKLRRLAEEHRVRLVYPMARDKWLVKLPEGGEGEPERRRSPKHCDVLNVFDELVSMPVLPADPNFSLEVLLIEEEEVRRREPGRAWRRNGWVVCERRLVEVVERRLFRSPEEVAGLLPADLPQRFTTADIAEACGIRRRLAQRMAYCLRKMEAIERIGNKGRAYLYERGV